MAFVLEINDNENGWGPSDVPENFSDLPYAPFDKCDKIGKIADWNASNYQRNYNNREAKGVNQKVLNDSLAKAFISKNSQDEEFVTINREQKQKQKKFFQSAWQRRNRYNNNRYNRNNNNNNENNNKRYRQNQQGGKKRKMRYRRNNYWNQRYNNEKKVLDPSVEIEDSWVLIDQIAFEALSRLVWKEPRGKDILTCGEVEYYDTKSFNNIASNAFKPLKKFERTFVKYTTTDDPIIRKLAIGEEFANVSANVFGTDAIIALLMCCPLSFFSWDIIVQKVGGKLFFDKRENSEFDYLTVNEGATNLPNEENNSINSQRNLSREATAINQHFTQQVLDPTNESYSFEQESPFESEDEQEIAHVGYRYRKFRLSKDIELVVRCEVDSVIDSNGKPKFLTVNALNEYDPKITGINWRTTLDSGGIGAILANEIKNNKNKLSKWTAEAILANSDQFVLGFVSRVKPTDPLNHTILGTQTYTPVEFSQQIGLRVNNMWGIVKAIIDVCMTLEEGKYILMKEPNKGIISLFSIPKDSFSDDEDDDDDDDDEEDDEFNQDDD
eukprot:TRINITY_DN224_c6_g1_i1.p1 TRINITY_DN224_c6_g1~~TRINITY_DN224_c6_g1_i1.p1  ORF type:complete len:564 (+),score=218.63 TRINITY_DN224_c6_g1_i1:29-1693(+)